jgi:nucleoside 2-deoxyribosyltransferase
MHERANGIIALLLTMDGWARFEALRKARIDSRRAFMAMKFGEDTLDSAVESAFKPAAMRAGFELRVLTDQQAAGLIDDQIRAALLAARFVVTDLTHGSYGAYWEAGYAEGRGIPVIYTCEKSVWQEKKTHFDTNHLVTIIWSSDELKKAENELVATIRVTLRAEAKQTDD